MTMTREKLIEKITGVLSEADRHPRMHPWDSYINYARAVLAAIESAGLRIVPADPTHAMLAHAWKAFRGNRQNQIVGPGPGFSEAIRAMIAASPLTDKAST